MTVTPHAGQVGHSHGAATGEIWRIAGPVVVARGLSGCGCTTWCASGGRRCPARSSGSRASWPRSRSMRTPADCASVSRCSTPAARWRSSSGPGCSARIFDGTQRPLEVLARAGDDPFGSPLLTRGADLPALDRGRPWTFEARVAKGDSVVAGDILGVVAETTALEHRILVPPHVSGVVTDVGSGPRRLEEPVAWIDGLPVTMLTRWPVRDPRPDRRPARRVDPADHRPAGDRRSLPDRPRRCRNNPRRLRDREDGAAAVPGEMGARRRRGVRRLR